MVTRPVHQLLCALNLRSPKSAAGASLACLLHEQPQIALPSLLLFCYFLQLYDNTSTLPDEVTDDKKWTLSIKCSLGGSTGIDHFVFLPFFIHIRLAPASLSAGNRVFSLNGAQPQRKVTNRKNIQAETVNPNAKCRLLQPD